MPYVMNGIGTWYYGKRNVFEHIGTCDSCNEDGPLASYDTTLYVVIVFVPVLPLGKKRILNECSHCKRHQALSLDEWEKSKAEECEKAIEAYRADPNNSEKARDVVGMAVSYQEKQLFMEIAPEVIANMGGDDETLNLTASVYGIFGLFSESERTHRLALEVEDKPETRELLAESLIRQLRSAEAEPFLDHIVEEQIPDKIWHLRLLAQGYQAEGKHEDALRVLDQCALLVPFISKDKDFKKLRKLSEKNRTTGKPIKQKDFESGGVVVEQGSGLSGKVALIIGPLILAAVLIGWIFAAYRAGESRLVYVVNGLDRPYTVEINGKPYRLPPFEPIEARIAEGEITLVVVDADLPIEPQTVTIKNNFFARPFVRKMYVINPDGVAPLTWQKIQYGTSRKGDQSAFGLRIGKTLYSFKHIEFKFEPFPDSVMTESDSTTRQQVDLLEGTREYPEEFIAFVSTEMGDKMGLEILLRHLKYNPESTKFLSVLAKRVEPEIAIEKLRAGLDVRPVRVLWHRQYQISKEKHDPEADLEGEYRGYLEQSPDDPDLLYLTARVTSDYDRAEELLFRATRLTPPAARGYRSLAYRRWCSGLYEEAEKFVNQALEIDPDDEEFIWLQGEILSAQGRHQEALEVYERAFDSDLTSHVSNARIAAAAIQAGDEKVVERANHNAYLRFRATGMEGADEFRERITRSTDINRAYLNEDFDALATILAEPDETGHNASIAGVIFGDVELAELGFLFMGDNLGDGVAEMEKLILSIVAGHSGHDESRKGYLAEAIALMRKAGYEMRVAAAMLSGEEEASLKQLTEMVLAPSQKALVLTALGMAQPDRREEFYELARRLNYAPGMPTVTLRIVLSGREFPKTSVVFPPPVDLEALGADLFSQPDASDSEDSTPEPAGAAAPDGDQP